MDSTPGNNTAHCCQFHHDARDLSEAVNRFVEDGVQRGQAVVVVATPDRIASLQHYLRSRGLGLSELVTVIKSGDLLRKVMRRGTPDETLFFRKLQPILDSAMAKGNGPPRVYGEMVNDLWQTGERETALRLEALWNEMLARHDFSLLCGYVIDAFDPKASTDHLERICRTHTSVDSTHSDQRARIAIDQACQEMLGFQLSRTLSHSQLMRDEWDVALPLSRRSVLWLQRNSPSRLVPVLRSARRHYENDHYQESAIGLVNA